VIESGLSDRDHLGMARAANELIDADVQLLVRVMRMGADRAVDIGKALGDGEHLGVPFDPGRDGDATRDAGRLRARNHGIELAGALGKTEVAVPANKHLFGALPAWPKNREKPGLGAGRGAPPAIRRAPPSAWKSRSSVGTASRSSSLAADLGMNG